MTSTNTPKTPNGARIRGAADTNTQETQAPMTSSTTVPESAGTIPPQRDDSIAADLSDFEAFRREKARVEKARKALEAADADERAQFAAWKAGQTQQASAEQAAKELAAAREQAVKDAARARKAEAQVRHGGQVRFAEAFVREHADAMRYVHGLGWHLWTGSHWKADEERHDIRLATRTLKSALRTMDRLNPQDRDDLVKDVKKVESASGIEGMLKIAGALEPLSVASRNIDADPYLFNTPAGTVDLRTGEKRASDRADLITKAAGAPIGEKSSEVWDRFIARILPDDDVRAFVQRLLGYGMLGKVTEHVMPIFHGDGANGKGTLRDAVMAAFGDYAIEVDPAILMESKHERHGAFKMRLRGARLVFCSETEKGRRFAEATMKRLVGGDPIEANLMHKNPITFDPSHLLIMMTNHLPNVSGDDPAVWRRIFVVPFDVVIPEEERDGELPGRLKQAGPAILAWVWQGWLDYQAQGLNPPEAVRARTLKYQQDSDVLARFLAERTQPNQNATELARDLFTAWSNWCRETREEPGTEKAFAESMEARGFAKKHTNRGRAYRGLMLLSDEEEPEEPDIDGGASRCLGRVPLPIPAAPNLARIRPKSRSEALTCGSEG